MITWYDNSDNQFRYLILQGEPYSDGIITPQMSRAIGTAYSEDTARKFAAVDHLLAACKEAHRLIYKDTASMDIRVQLHDAIARAEGKASQGVD